MGADGGKAAHVAGTQTDKRLERGRQTRRLVLGRTMEIASVEGLDGLSLGRIAGELGLSKSGVFALFGSKEELQLATIRAASSVVYYEVVEPAERAPAGLARICAVCEHWIAYSKHRIFPGGCFFFATAAEFAARTGAVRDAVAGARSAWLTYLTQQLIRARELGELRADADVDQLVFELTALLDTANAQSALHGDDSGYRRAAEGALARLRAAATDPSALPHPLRH
jgi:AcrR family transcriptional regulator